ncbi:hypothetical protein Vadar_030492 [Vaccinium darrowii]|uniref:Uncharacterized protein n=1 Tax=Vaccinium darrowii TaxID=229202 RepID=A0ACB7Y2V2_9ERIC|nr:hypothetical protein Vadar_030492 [Vaccinium darrowii]
MTGHAGVAHSAHGGYGSCKFTPPSQNTTQSKGHEWVVKAGAKPVAAVELIDTSRDLELGAETLGGGSSLPGVGNVQLAGGLDPRGKVVASSRGPGTSKLSPVPSGAGVVHSPILAQSNSFSALALVEDKEEAAHDLDDGKEKSEKGDAFSVVSMDVEVGPLSPLFNSVLSPPIAPVVNKKKGRGRGAWNIRGLNDPLKQKEVLSFIRSQKLSLVGIVETKVRSENFDKTVRFCFPAPWASIHNGSNDRVSRIIVAWNALDVTVDIIFSSPQLVVVKVLSADQKLFYVSFVYGHNSVVDRRSLWIDMKTMALSIGNAPWIQLGDFNVVRNPTERLMGFDKGASDEFNACLDSVGMDDMPSKGFWFTWSNKRSGLGDNKSKLDRVLINVGAGKRASYEIYFPKCC